MSLAPPPLVQDGPLFRSGQWVTVKFPRAPLVTGRLYRITKVMPAADRPQRYHVKSEFEVFERVVDEGAITAAPRD